MAARSRVAIVTGTRAEYGLLKSSIEAITGHAKLELHLVVCGMHLLKKFGRTVADIEADGWTIAARIPMQQGNDNATDQAEGLARGVSGMARFFEKARTEVVLVLGDRIEAMAGALAAVTTGRILAHVHGGDVAPGDFDGSLRDAITKLAHMHFPATPTAARRILRMGEEKRRIHVVGAPGLDRLIQLKGNRKKPQNLGLNALILHHPCGRSPAVEEKVMTALLGAVTDCGLSRTIIYPNTDRGHSGIVHAIERHQQSSPKGMVRVHRSLKHEDYLRALVDHRVLVGNSSSGIVEASAAGTLSVNVGDRQKGRERAVGWVLDSEESRSSIRAALQSALKLRSRTRGRGPYGDGRAGHRIADYLAKLPLDDAFKRKLPVR